MMTLAEHLKFHKALNAFLEAKRMLPKRGFSSQVILQEFGEEKIIQTFRAFYNQKWRKGSKYFEAELKAFRAGSKAVSQVP